MDLLFDISQEELPIFLAEADDHLQTLDEVLVQLERNDDPELIQQAFRAAHTLKGMAGMINHKRMVDLTHALETAFDGVRKHTLNVSSPLIDVCLDAIDGLRILRDEVSTGQESDLDISSMMDRFSKFIQSGQGGTPSSSKPPTSVETPPVSKNTSEKKEATSPKAKKEKTAETPVKTAPTGMEITADINAKSIAPAARAFQLYMAVQDLGPILAMDPPLEVIESSTPVFHFSARVDTAKTIEQIRKNFDPISELDQVTINGQVFDMTPPPPPPAQMPVQETPRAGESAAPMQPRPAASLSNNAQKSDHGGEKTVRTSVERLDSLMNLVGELITDRNRLVQIRNRFESESRGNENLNILTETTIHLGRITDQLQEEMMRIRMMPISNVFSRFPRLVRDLAQKTGKEVELIVHGEDTELDRSVIEEINDPLIHLIRNSIGHGIESPEERIALGKPRRGTIILTARHEQGHILLTVEDDGKGIDAQKIKNTAIQKGLLSAAEAAELSDEKAVDLIFLSGFSTAQKVDDISGRGVGMDIVRNNIQHINGTMTVETTPGKGTKFQINLPLTLAIVPTLLVRVHEISFAIPLVMILETLRITQKDIYTVRTNPVIRLRDKVLPLLNVARVLDLDQEENQHPEVSYVVVVSTGKMQVGLIVDSLIGEEEVVVKSLGALIGDIPGISSAAILGDGQVALIVDVIGLFRLSGIH